MNPITSTITQWAGNLKMPKLLALVATLFVVDLFVPDAIPFIDEIVLGLATIVLSNLKRKKHEKTAP